jgi:hypothetical protein
MVFGFEDFLTWIDVCFNESLAGFTMKGDWVSSWCCFEA